MTKKTLITAFFAATTLGFLFASTVYAATKPGTCASTTITATSGASLPTKSNSIVSGARGLET